ncbi:hypothetical protein MUK42_07174 [Musa troglodytarum]|uniref:Uncharacterized protein n=1 Tax=Musa troglodytarum TaxID=320322 RepID=A0A9E7G5E1_9LILI|nr:hypothetical protein MUK42_07174 [Musa troglodytarum]
MHIENPDDRNSKSTSTHEKNEGYVRICIDYPTLINKRTY